MCNLLFQILFQESDSVEELNIKLKREVQRLQAEKENLQRFLNDATHLSTCKYVPPAGTIAKSYPNPTSECSSSYAFCSTTSPSYASPASSSSPSYCSSASPCSFTSLLSPSDSKDFIVTNMTSCSSGSTSNSIGVAATNNNNITSATSNSLEYIEPTISLDASTTKMVPSKCKSSSIRYHPYVYNGQNSTRTPSTTSNIYPGTSYGANIATCSQYNQASGEVRDLGQGGSAPKRVMEDIKTNPFRYPVVASVNTFRDSGSGEIEYSCHDVPGGDAEYRGGKSLSRYSNYPLGGNPQTDPVGCSISAAEYCGELSSTLQNPFFPPCTYP